MSINLLQSLKVKYSLDYQGFDRLLYEIIENELGGLNPVSGFAKVFLVVCQAGVNTTAIEKQIFDDNSGNVCIISDEKI